MAEKATGIHPIAVVNAFAPEIACDQVKEELSEFNNEGRNSEHTIYRVTCLGNREWGQKLLTACRNDPGSVDKEYWIYYPELQEAGFVNCKTLEREGLLP